jgi:hypothetical protein
VHFLAQALVPPLRLVSYCRLELELEGELDGAGTSDLVKRAETASEVKGRRSADDRVLHSPARQVLTCFGVKAKRFRGGGSSRASIRGGARCLVSGTALAGFRLK